MDSDTLKRNTIFALVIAVEQDLRRVFAVELCGSPLPLSTDELQIIINRIPQGPSAPSSTAHWTELLDYFDLSQTLTILSHYVTTLSSAFGTTREVIKNLIKHLLPLIPIRNRVCHARPIEPDDLVITWEKTKALMTGDLSIINFTNLQDVINQLGVDTSYPLKLTIPEFWQNDIKVGSSVAKPH